MKKPVIVIGAGGHGKVVADALRESGRKVLGFIDTNPKLAGKSIIGVKVLGGDDVLRKHGKNAVELANGRGSSEDMSERRRVFEKYKALGFTFTTVVHPSAVISRHAVLREGAQAMAGVVVQAGAVIGIDCIVNTRASVDHDCNIGAHCHIAPGVTLSGNVEVGAESHIGVGATVRQQIRIGKRVLVGAGAVVLTDVAGGCRALGVPAKISRK